MKNLHNALQLKQLYQLKHLGYHYTDAQVFSYAHKHTLELPSDLTQLHAQARNCHLCALSKQRQRVVCGEGNPDAEIMIIGDAPIEIEDEQGRIFLGRSGEMLTAMIENVLHLPREAVYLTNLLKCRPPATQPLHESAMHTCKAYLFKEIELVQPTVIVTLGEAAYHYLTGDTTPLGKIRGNLIHRGDYTVIPTHHPNFLLKNPSYKREVFVDLQRVTALI